ncbi:MAG: bacillithiol system redox-active protein YtxJ [Phycisphaeraceae bacterium]|nr:bacillithiol system redox-active protein YtxJ [Phycisphaeraceae bacterium]
MSRTVHEIQSLEEADAWMERSTPVWLFKYSNACGFSETQWRVFEQFGRSGRQYEAARVVVQKHRDVSDHIARRLGVRHETPQVLLVRGGRCLWNGSHSQITEAALKDAEQQASEPGWQDR